MIDVSGKNVVVTGVIVGESRATAEAKLTQAGATVQRAVNGSTDLLVTGAKVGKAKTTKAAQLGVQVVTWEALWNGGGPSGPPSVKAVTKQFGSDRTKTKLYARPARVVAPMLAKAAGELPVGEGWQYEVKWDGYRCVATVRDGQVTMQSRSGKTDYAEQFPEVAAALAQLPDCVLDGELVVLDENGDSSIERMSTGGGDYVVFDVLEVAGNDVRGRTLQERRQALEWFLEEETSLVVSAAPVHLSPRFFDGEELLAWASDRKLEGIVAKRLGSTYREGTRGDAWLKIKLRCEQEFVVIGWTPGQGALAGHVGAFLLAVNDAAGDLVFTGKVGTGGTLDQWDGLQARLKTVRVADQRVDLASVRNAMAGPEFASVTWVAPELVVQVRFQRWTEDGRLWHPSLIGVRDDKDPGDVVREANDGAAA